MWKNVIAIVLPWEKLDLTMKWTLSGSVNGPGTPRPDATTEVTWQMRGRRRRT